MISVAILIATIAWIGIVEGFVASSFLNKTFRPSPAMVIAISAAKNLSRFVFVFAVLYAMKIDFDNAGNWSDIFQR
jgi:hypothetical protein